jgi:hypothetical protein
MRNYLDTSSAAQYLDGEPSDGETACPRNPLSSSRTSKCKTRNTSITRALKQRNSVFAGVDHLQRICGISRECDQRYQFNDSGTRY